MKIIKHLHKISENSAEYQKARGVEDILRNIKIVIKPRCATELRNAILEELRKNGWSGEIRINARHNITLTGMKDRTAICIQTGNMARFYADLLKIQAHYQRGNIESAVYIVPTAEAARQMGENMANFERLTSELFDLFSDVITTPIFVYGIED
jgi:hypothetical protein